MPEARVDELLTSASRFETKANETQDETYRKVFLQAAAEAFEQALCAERIQKQRNKP